MTINLEAVRLLCSQFSRLFLTKFLESHKTPCRPTSTNVLSGRSTSTGTQFRLRPKSTRDEFMRSGSSDSACFEPETEQDETELETELESNEMPQKDQVKKDVPINQVFYERYFHLLDPNIAETVAKKILAVCSPSSTLLEFHSGNGCLTEKLLKFSEHRVITGAGSDAEQLARAQKLQSVYGIDRLPHILQIDHLFGQLRRQHAINEITKFVEARPWKSDSPLSVIGVFPVDRHKRVEQTRLAPYFMMVDVLNQQCLFQLGRVDYFLFVPPALYLKLKVPFPPKSLLEYTRNAIMLNLLFDVTLLMTLKKSSFTPTYPKQKTTLYLDKHGLDPDSLYLIHMQAKPHLYTDIATAKELHMVSALVQQLVAHRTRRLIPRLEEWMTGCGLNLIDAGFTLMRRPSNLSPMEYVRLFRVLVSCPQYEDSTLQKILNESLPLEDNPSDDD